MRLIDADAAIRELEIIYRRHGDKATSALIEDLKNFPTVEPQRMRGEWIEDGYSHYKAVCSECGEPCATYIMGKPRDKFCKWCGADMRGDEDG